MKKTIYLFIIALLLVMLSSCGGSCTFNVQYLIPEEEHVHSFSEDWSYDDIYHYHSSTCGHDAISELAEHTFGDWTTVKEPSESETGLQIRKCTVCDCAFYKVTSRAGELYTKFEEYVYFGSYPQTQVKDNIKLMELKYRIGDLPDESNYYNWTPFSYCYKDDKPYMYYLDVDTNKDGLMDYRAIYLTDYRTYLPDNDTGDYYTYQDNNGFTINNVYWFAYEPIKWRILQENDDAYFLLSDLLIDGMQYNEGSETEMYVHNGEMGYANNYELSLIRHWLNEDFKQTVFTHYQKDIIQITHVLNDQSTLVNQDGKYYCPDTFDQIFLLSFSESETYLVTAPSRKAYSTDYAQSQGLWVSKSFVQYDTSYWWLRSPSSSYGNYVSSVYCDGYYYGHNCGITSFGIRPALWINK